MPQSDPTDAAQVLIDATGGDGAAAKRLMPQVYDGLRELAAAYLAAGRWTDSLPPTALVHEAYLRLIDQTRTDWHGRTHFFAVAAEMMRRILVDHARHRRAAKRGEGWKRITLDEAAESAGSSEWDILAVDDALNRLAVLDARQARVVELRFFAGLTVEEIAQTIGVSPRTVEGDWRLAKAWMRREFGRE